MKFLNSKFLMKFLRGRDFFYSKDRLFLSLTENYSQALLATRGLYVLSFIFFSLEIGWMPGYLSNPIYSEPLWPLLPFTESLLQVLAWPFYLSALVGSLVCIFYPENRWFRGFHATAVFVVVAMTNSDGHFAHNTYAMMWIFLFLIFLPHSSTSTGLRNRSYKFTWLTAFWMAQLGICFFYLLTGIWKLEGIAHCALGADMSCQLDHKILMNLSGKEAALYFQFAPFRDILFENPWFSFLSYMGTIWIHLVSLYFAFRWDTHRLFGFLRLVFHLGTFLFFGVDFGVFAIFVSLLFLMSPFDRVKNPLQSLKALFTVPPFHLIGKMLSWDVSSLKSGAMEVSRATTSFLLLFSSIFVVIPLFVASRDWEHLAEKSIIGDSEISLLSPAMSFWLGMAFLFALFPQYLTFRVLLIASTAFGLFVMGLFSESMLGVTLSLLFLSGFLLSPARWLESAFKRTLLLSRLKIHTVGLMILTLSGGVVGAHYLRGGHWVICWLVLSVVLIHYKSDQSPFARR